MNDEFYIGWDENAPPGIRRRVRGAVAVLLALVIGTGIALAIAQQTIGVSVFEWGHAKSFTGVLRSRPYPHLLVQRPGTENGHSSQSVPSRVEAFSSYYLVKPFKFGLDTDTADRFDGKTVRLQGTLIHRDNQTMIEVVDGSIQSIDASTGPAAAADTAPARLGRQTLVGEIVDSKCYLGVMNPGALTPHRACAIRCISGGIPPVLLVRRTDGPALCFLLVSSDGKPVNKQILDLVAEPVEITGEVERQGELLILRADPATYRRVKAHDETRCARELNNSL